MKKPKSNLQISIFLAVAITLLEILVWFAFYYTSEHTDSIPDLTYALWSIVNMINLVPHAITALFSTYVSDAKYIPYSVFIIFTFLQNLAIIYIVVFNSRRKHNHGE